MERLRNDKEITKDDVDDVIQKLNNAAVHDLYTWLNDPNRKFKTRSQDPRTNLVDQRRKCCYILPEDDVKEFMRRYWKAVKDTSIYAPILRPLKACPLALGFSERQGLESMPYTGLAFDYDLVVASDKTDITKDLSKIASSICCLAMTHLTMKNVDTKVFIIARPQMTKIVNEGVTAFKTGFHIVVPGIQTTRSYKKFIMKELAVAKRAHRALDGLGILKPLESCLDQQYASNPVLLLGSSKTNGYVYQLTHVLNVCIDDIEEQADVKHVAFSEVEKYNLAWEMSLCSQAEYDDHDPLVVKHQYDVRAKYQVQVDEHASRTQGNILSAEDLADVDHEIDFIASTDVNARQVKMYLEILDPPHYEQRDKWRNIVYAIANTSEKYFPLVKAFSQRCPQKYSEVDLQKLWDEAIEKKRTNAVKNPVTIASLRYLAKTSQPSKFQNVLDKDVFNMISKYAYTHKGRLGHYHLAKVLHMMFSDRFAVVPNGAGRANALYTWFEFMMPGQQMARGEVWKWRECEEPDSLQVYISEGLEVIMRNVLEDIKSRKNNADDEKKSKAYERIESNFHATLDQLFMHGYKTNIIKECNCLFIRREFLNALDMDGQLFGVGNGILKLGPKVEFISHYHEYLISRYTPVHYKPFDPKNPGTKKMLDYFRDIFPERDARLRLIFGFADVLNGYSKDPEMTILTASGRDGKTTLMLLLRKVYGMYGDTIPQGVLTGPAPSADRPNSAVANLRGKRFIYSEETDRQGVLNSNTIKSLNSPGEISVRDLHRKQMTIQNTWRMWLATNHPPGLDAKDYAVLRRILFYMMKIKFTENPKNDNERIVDPDVASKWPNDEEILSGLLSILVYFYEVLYSRFGGNIKYVKSPTIEAETQEYFNRNDFVNKFITTMLVESPSSTEVLPMNQIVLVYKAWLSSIENVDKRCHHDTNSIQSEFMDHPVLQKRFLSRDSEHNTFLVKCRILTREAMSLLPDEKSLSVEKPKEEDRPSITEMLANEPEDWWIIRDDDVVVTGKKDEENTHEGEAEDYEEVKSEEETYTSQEGEWRNDDFEIIQLERREAAKALSMQLDAELGI